MSQLLIQKQYQLIEDFFAFHLKVLREVLNGKSFDNISKNLGEEFIHFNYQEVASTFTLMKYNKNGELSAAIPLSPKRTDYRVTVDGVGSGYALCAADSLGVAYLFGAKTVIDSVDLGSKKPIKIVIDPLNPEIEGYSDITITTTKNIIPNKKEGEMSEVTVEICPLVGFVRNFELIPEEQSSLVNRTSFEQGLNMAKLGFDPEFMKSELKSYIIPLILISQEGSLTEKKLTKVYLRNSKNPFTQLVPFEDLRRSIVNQFIARGIIQHAPRTKSLELTPKGKRIVRVFYNV